MNLRLPSKRIAARVLGVAAIGTLAGVALTGCSPNEINPNAVGLYYSAGMIEGRGFQHVVEPGKTDFTVNDFVVQLPTGQRSYIIRKDDRADVNGVISVPSQDNTLIDFEVSVAFKLNTLTDDIGDFEGGTLRKFYEDICRHYQCELDGDGNSPDGWDNLLREKLYPQLESAFKDEARKFEGDDIVGNTATTVNSTEVGTLTHLQQTVGALFQQYLERQTGAKFFCAPKFDRKLNPDCGPVELLIISADYNNKEVRASREAKKIATDQAAAQTELQRALSDPNYLEYLRIQAIRECTQSAKAICVVSAAPGANISVNPPKSD